MSGDSKFIQIAATSMQIGGREREVVFALDTEGDVWQYRFLKRGKADEVPMWVPLVKKRGQAPLPF